MQKVQITKQSVFRFEIIWDIYITDSIQLIIKSSDSEYVYYYIVSCRSLSLSILKVQSTR